MAADQILRFIGLPSENPSLFAPPPNFFEQRENLDFSYIFQTNSIGLRNAEVPRNKDGGETRLLFLGDSFVEGYGVDVEQTFVATLEASFSAIRPRIRFINGGLSGTGPMEYARLYYKVGGILDLDWIVICIYPNDLTGTRTDYHAESVYALPVRSGLRKLLHQALPRLYTQASLSGVFQTRSDKGFISKVSARAREVGRSEHEIEAWAARLPPQIVEAIDSDQFNGAILASGLLSPEYWVESLDLAGPAAPAKWTAMTNILDETIRMAAAREHRVAFVYIPARFQYASPGQNRRLWEQAGTKIRDHWRTEDSELQTRLAHWAAEKSLPFLDLTRTFRDANNDSLVYPRDDHWSPAGHQLAALTIGAWLQDIQAVHDGPLGSRGSRY